MRWEHLRKSIESEIARGFIEAEFKELPEQPGATSCIGKTKNMTFVLVEFDIESQGFPPGSKGYDGTASDPKSEAIMRLPRPLAERAFKRARKQLG